MRLLFVCPDMHRGGAERQWATLIPALARRGAEVRLVCLYDEGPLFDEVRAAGVAAECLGLHGPTDVRGMRRALREASGRPGAVVTRTITPQVVGEAIARRAGGVHVFNEHTPLTADGELLPMRPRQRLLTRAVASKVDRVIAVSERQADPLTRLGYRRDRIVTVPNGVSANDVKTTADRDATRASLGLAADEFAVLCVANLRPEKGVDAFVEAVARARIEGVRSDGARSERGRSEGGRSEGGPSEGGPSEGGPSEGARSEGGRSEGGRSDGGGSEGGGSEGAGSEDGRSEGDRSEGDRSEGDRSEGGRSEGDRSEGGRSEGAPTEGVGSLRGLVAGDGPERQRLERLVAGLEGVELLGSRGDVPDLIAACDAFALLSEAEALPMSILEAMALGMPVVTTDVGGAAEAVADGETGIVVPPGNTPAAAAALAALAADPARAREMGERGRTRQRERFDADAMVDGYWRALEEVATR